MLKETEVSVGRRLEVVRQTALARMDAYLQLPQERDLWENQLNSFGGFRDGLARGETAGYISSPAGSGKTLIETTIIDELKLNTIVVTPTQVIHRQTATALAEDAPGLQVSIYKGQVKDVSGKVINASLQSLGKLAEIPAVREATELIVCDEVDFGPLGEKYHELWRKFPNAILLGLTATPAFDQLGGLIQRGKVKSSERWVGMFRNKWADMSLGEAMERGIVAPLDIMVFKTNIKVGSVSMSKGDYNQADLEKYLRTHARDLMVVGMLAGVDKLPEYFKPTQEQYDWMAKIHSNIQDKRTAVFGLSIAHIEEFAALLRKVTKNKDFAKAVHSKLDDDERDRILESHRKGDIPVVLGVDALGRGWNSPETEAGIFMNQTRSGSKAVQELCRLDRWCTWIGKERAIAVQLVDTFERPSQAPILIPDIFDPYFILRGTQKGRERIVSGISTPSERPVFTISGMHINTIVEQAKSEDLIRRVQNRLKHADFEQKVEIVDEVITQTAIDNPQTSPYELYRKIAEQFPPRLTIDIQQDILQAVASIDSNTAEQGKKLFAFLNLKTVLAVIEPYMGENRDERDDLVQEGISVVYGMAEKIDPEKQITMQVHNAVTKQIVKYIAARDNLSSDWIINKKVEKIVPKVNQLLKEYPYGLDKYQMREKASELAGELDVTMGSVENYLKYKYETSVSPDAEVGQEHEVFNAVWNKGRSAAVEKVLATLSEREAGVMRLRFGMVEDGKQRNMDEVGQVYGVTRERIRQIEIKTLSKLRNPNRSQTLRPYLHEE